MSINTFYNISNYYDYYRDESVVFTNSNINALKLDPKKVVLKINRIICPCIINTTSMLQATVLVPSKSSILNIIKKNDNHLVNLKYSFLDSNDKDVEFFVNCSLESIEEYEHAPSFYKLSLTYTKRPSNELILRLGRFLEINKNYKAFNTDMIDITINALSILGIQKAESMVLIFGVPRKCIIKSLSFSSAIIVAVGVPKYLIDKTSDLTISFIDTFEELTVKGVVSHAEFIEGRKDICKIEIVFNKNTIPISYKAHLNTYFMNYKKKLNSNIN